MVRFLDVAITPGTFIMSNPVLLILVLVILVLAVAFIVKFVILRKYSHEKFLEKILGDNEEDK